MIKTSYSHSFIKQLKKYDTQTIQKILESISKIPDGNIKKLQGLNLDNIFRLRIGKYRVIFRIESDEIFIDKVDTRGDIYK